jgi:type VI secretion system secreted protein Hcp
VYVRMGNGLGHMPDTLRPAAPAAIGFGALPAGAARFFVTLKGSKQGNFVGEGPFNKVLGLAFHFDVRAPADPSTGLATGHRRYQPIVFTKEWGAASPQIFQALVTNEVLPSVLFEFLRATAAGAEGVFQTITLSNVRVIGLERHLRFNAAGQQTAADPRMLEDVSLAFQGIEIQHKSPSLVAVDSWRA